MKTTAQTNAPNAADCVFQAAANRCADGLSVEFQPLATIWRRQAVVVLLRLPIPTPVCFRFVPKPRSSSRVSSFRTQIIRTNCRSWRASTIDATSDRKCAYGTIMEEPSDEKEITNFVSRAGAGSDISPARISSRWLDRDRADYRRKKPTRHDLIDSRQPFKRTQKLPHRR